MQAPNSFYCSLDGVLFNSSQTTLVQCPGGKAGSYTIPATVTNIGTGAFYCCSSLTNVTIPNSVLSIGPRAFDLCNGLTTITFPSSIANIGTGAFGSCNSYTNLIGAYFEGNAPKASGIFDIYSKAMVYYLPGTTGGVRLFAVVRLCSGGRRCRAATQVLECGQTSLGSTSIGCPAGPLWWKLAPTWPIRSWFAVGTNTLVGSSCYFSDPQWTNYPGCFYRLRWP